MKPDEKSRIVVRVEPDEWKRMDDKRHEQRESFQQLGLRLFRQWLEGAISSDVKRFSLPKDSQPHTPSTNLAAHEPPVVNVNWHETGELWARHKEAIENLLYILEFGPKGMPEDIKGNLHWFAKAARMLNERPGVGPAKPPEKDTEGGAARARELESRHRGGGGDTRQDEGPTKPSKKRTG